MDDVKSPESEYQHSIFMAGHQVTACQESLSDLRGTSINILSEVACMVVVIDSELKFALHIKRLSGICFSHMRQLRLI